MNKPLDCSNEKALVNGLKKGDTEAFELLYLCCYKSISSLVRTNSGTEEDARDIFQDAILVLINNLRKPEFKLTAKCCVFLYSVARFQWLNKLKKKGHFAIEINETTEKFISIEADDSDLQKEYENKHDIISNVLRNWDHEVCKKLIVAFYYQKLDLREIAKMLNYTYEFVRIKKHRCMKSFEKLVKEHQTFKDY